MAKRADQGRQMQKINARETSHSSAPHRTQSAASVPPGTRPASTPSQTIGDDNVRKHGVPLVLAPEKAKGTQPEKRHRKRETKHGQHSSRPKQRSRPTDGSSVKVSRDRSGVKSEECHVDQHKKKRSKQRLADAKSVDKVARKRKSKHQPSRAGDGNNSDDADAIARRLLASKRSIAVKSLPDSPAKSEDNASCIAVGNNKKEMEDLVDTIARKEQMILQNQMEIQYFYHKWQFLQRKEDVAANEAKCATVRIRRIGKARQKASQLVASSEKLFAEEEYQASILELLRATAIEQSNAKAWNLLAQCRMKVVDYVAAEIACRKCIQYQDTPSNLVLLGQIMMCQGHPDEAIEYYQKALAVCNI
ncbi:unnamed protein product [Albugo candida]|uniref:Uncharacterized protein n=1 Tax=Albugo candida TaxID=65357 RepID=A0A024GQJ7_9STRA|nr:unnamed protein product [Albugo candida]|eukprot:CCI48981.1 unnamed protein product [Albugo candida]